MSLHDDDDDDDDEDDDDEALTCKLRAASAHIAWMPDSDTLGKHHMTIHRGGGKYRQKLLPQLLHALYLPRNAGLSLRLLLLWRSDGYRLPKTPPSEATCHGHQRPINLLLRLACEMRCAKPT
eukprot:1670562-Amphidinium_carterae.2